MTFSFSYICMQIQFWKANKKLYRHRITVDGSQDWISTSMSCLLCSPDCLPAYNNSTLICDCSILLEYKVNVDTRTLSIAYRFWHHVQISDYSEWAFTENNVSHFISTSKKLKPMWSTDTVQWKPLFFPVFFWFFFNKIEGGSALLCVETNLLLLKSNKTFPKLFFPKIMDAPPPPIRQLHLDQELIRCWENIPLEGDYLEASPQVNRLCCLQGSQQADLTRGPSYRLNLDTYQCRSFRGQLWPASVGSIASLNWIHDYLLIFQYSRSHWEAWDHAVNT